MARLSYRFLAHDILEMYNANTDDSELGLTQVVFWINTIVKNVTKTFSDKLVETSMYLNVMSEFEVVERAEAEKLEITSDVDDIRRRLVYTITEKAMQGGVQGMTHHKIAAADPTFDHTSDTSMEEATKDAKQLETAPAQ